MRRFSLIAFVILPFAALSQQNLLTLEQAIGTALQNNYNILMAKNDSISFAVDRSYVYAGFLPRLNGAALQNWNLNAQKVELANFSNASEAFGDCALRGQLNPPI